MSAGMRSPDNLAALARRIEEQPQTGAQAFDTLAGGLLRTFSRLNQLEAAYADLRERLAALEGAGGRRPKAGEDRQKYRGPTRSWAGGPAK